MMTLPKNDAGSLDITSIVTSIDKIREDCVFPWLSKQKVQDLGSYQGIHIFWNLSIGMYEYFSSSSVRNRDSTVNWNVSSTSCRFCLVFENGVSDSISFDLVQDYPVQSHVYYFSKKKLKQKNRIVCSLLSCSLTNVNLVQMTHFFIFLR